MLVFENQLIVQKGYGEQIRNLLQSLMSQVNIPGMLSYEVVPEGQTGQCEQICVRSIWESQKDFQAYMRSKDFQATHCGKCLPYLVRYQIRFNQGAEQDPVSENQEVH